MSERSAHNFRTINIDAFNRYLFETVFNYSFTESTIETDIGNVYIQIDEITNMPDVAVVVTYQAIDKNVYETIFSFVLKVYSEYNVPGIVVLSIEEGDKETIEILNKEVQAATGNKLIFKSYDLLWLQGIFNDYPEIEHTWFGQRNNDILKRLILSNYKKTFWWINVPYEVWFPETMQEMILADYLDKIGWKPSSEGDIVLFNVLGEINQLVGVYYLSPEFQEMLTGTSKLIFRKRISWDELTTIPSFTESEIFRAQNKESIYPISYNLTKQILNQTELAPFPVVSNQSQEIIDELTIPESETFRSTPLNSDDPNATQDLLGFTNDVRAFATIMALKATRPPLAIALFGAWGSGKSFFMNKLRSYISELSDNQGFLSEYESGSEPNKPEIDRPFCDGVVQIEFNAWSYLDANLWAGLVSTIFERLDEYFTENTKGDVAKMHIRQKLVDKLSILGKQKSNKLEQKQLYEKVKSELELERKELHKERQNELMELTKITLHAVTNNDDLYNQIVKLGLSDLIKTAENPDELRKQIGSIKTAVKSSVQKYITKRNILLLLASIAVGAGVYVLIRMGAVNTIKGWWHWLAGMAAPVIAFVSTYAPHVKKYVAVAKELNQKRKDVTDKFNEVKATSKHFDLIDRKIKQNEKVQMEHGLQISKLEAEMEDVTNILSGDLTKEAFFDYIGQINSRGDYEKHLGIISIIRRDFETLSELFSQERVEQRGNDAIEVTSEDREEVQSQLEKPLDRIILYIDDLDRCDDSKVLEVLQAVHLLMAFPLFIVVVGVDKRCVNNALIHRNTLQYSRLLCDRTLEQLEKEFKLNLIHPDEYLEKIFQIPFHLVEAADGGMQDLVYDMLKDQVEIPEEVEPKKFSDLGKFAEDFSKPVGGEVEEEFELQRAMSKRVGEHIDETTGEEKKVYKGASKQIGMEFNKTIEAADAVSIYETTPGEEEDQAVLNDEMNADLVVVKPSELQISPDELEFLQQATWLVGVSPRTMKRFINMYRIIRMHQQLQVSNDNPNADYLAIIFILALSVGHYKDIADNILCRCINNQSKSLAELLVGSDDEEINKTEQSIKDKLDSSDKIKAMLNLTGEHFTRYIPFISRFSFRANTSMFTRMKCSN